MMAKTADERKIILAQHERFTTERLVLRKIELSDAADLFEYTQDPEIGDLAGFKLVADLQTQQLNIINNFMPNRPYMFGLELKATGKVLGTISLWLSGDGADIGWVMNRQFWGQGLMPEAGLCLRDFAFQTLKIEVLMCSCLAGNHQSARVMEKLGMKKLGQIYVADTKGHNRLSDYYALTKDDFVSREKNYAIF